MDEIPLPLKPARVMEWIQGCNLQNIALVVDTEG